LISAVLGTELPGPGSIYLSQSINFRAPVFINDTITATVTVVKIREGKPIVTLETVCKNQDGVTVLEGEAVLLAPTTG
jgi:acyl dehydratase